MVIVSNDTQQSDENQVQRIAAWIARFISYLVYIYLVVVEIILFLGFFLLLFGANPSSGFVEWVYRSVDRAMRPFRGIFEPIELGTTNNDVPAVFETSILFAMIIYGILAILLHSLIEWLSSRIKRIDRDNEVKDRQQEYQDAMAQQQAYQQAMLQQNPQQQVPGSQPATTPVPAADQSLQTPPSGQAAPPPPDEGTTS
jgi:uncharacterized protein YggT (Ycf19 family)